MPDNPQNPSGGSVKSRWSEVFTIGGFNKFKRPLAKSLAATLNPWFRRFLIAHEVGITAASMLLAKATPSWGVWIVTDLQMDFVNELVEACKVLENKAPGQVTQDTQPFDADKQLLRSQRILSTLDAATRDEVRAWFNSLTKEDKLRFLRFAAEAGDEELKGILQQPTWELQGVIDILNLKLGTKQETQSQLEFIEMVEAAGLQDKVLETLAGTAFDELTFWNHVENMHYMDIQKFERLMKRPVEERRARLGLDPKGRKLAQVVRDFFQHTPGPHNDIFDFVQGAKDKIQSASDKVNQGIESSGLPAWSEGIYEKTKRWAEAADPNANNQGGRQ